MTQLVPVRWPPEDGWLTPAALALLDNTPVNCLVMAGVVPPAFAAEVRRRNLTLISGEPPAAVIKDPVWPGVQRSQRGTSTSDAGPTGPPWVDANGWAVMLARAKSPGQPVWVPSEPKAGAVLRPEHYALAAADAEAYGGRWMITLDPITRKGLLSGESQAREAWTTLVRTLRFFDGRRAAMSGYRPLARLGIISSFEGADEFLSTEVLNLAARRHIAYRIVVRPKLDLHGLSAALWVHEKAPEGEEKSAVTAFVQAGGTLILPASAARMTDGLQRAGTSAAGYPFFGMGKGRIAVSPQPWSDPYVVAADANRIMTRRSDMFRLWNAGASNVFVQSDGARTLVQVLNFTGRPAGHPMSLWIARQAASAKFHDLFGRTETLTVTAKSEGSEVSLPAFSSYAAVEFGDTA